MQSSQTQRVECQHFTDIQAVQFKKQYKQSNFRIISNNEHINNILSQQSQAPLSCEPPLFPRQNIKREIDCLNKIIKNNQLIKFSLQMYKNIPLSPDQIQQLRIEVTKIMEQNMISFTTKAAANADLTIKHDLDTLFEFSQREYERLRKTLENLGQFTFLIMTNFEMVWEQVHHRQNRIMELRQSFSSATNYMEELKTENEEVKYKLSELETYIDWIEEEKEYLDAIYYQKGNSTINLGINDNVLSRCVSERSLKWNENRRKKNMNYEKLRQYIDTLKDERNEIERQLFTLTKKYDIKCLECKKANMCIEHLVDKLNRKMDTKEYIDPSTTDGKDTYRSELISDDILKILERTENIPSSSLKNNLFLVDEEVQRCNFPHFESFTHLRDSPNKEENEQNVSFMMSSKEMKDANVNTVQTYVGRKAAATQTKDSGNSSTASEQEESSDFKISISIVGPSGGKEKQDKIAKIIEQFNLEKEIEQKLKQKDIKRKQQFKAKKQQKVEVKDSGKLNEFNKTLLSTYEYYRNRFVANRIKKYHFNKPDSKPLPKCIRAK